MAFCAQESCSAMYALMEHHVPLVSCSSPAATASAGDGNVGQRVHSAAQHRRLHSLSQSQVQNLGQEDAHELLITVCQRSHPRTQQQSSLQDKAGVRHFNWILSKATLQNTYSPDSSWIDMYQCDNLQ